MTIMSKICGSKYSSCLNHPIIALLYQTLFKNNESLILAKNEFKERNNQNKERILINAYFASYLLVVEEAFSPIVGGLVGAFK